MICMVRLCSPILESSLASNGIQRDDYGSVEPGSIGLVDGVLNRGKCRRGQQRKRRAHDNGRFAGQGHSVTSFRQENSCCPENICEARENRLRGAARTCANNSIAYELAFFRSGVMGGAGAAPYNLDMSDVLTIAGRTFHSRLFVGTGKYRSNQEMARCHQASGAEVVTVAVRRVNLADRSGESLLDYIDRAEDFHSAQYRRLLHRG